MSQAKIGTRTQYNPETKQMETVEYDYEVSDDAISQTNYHEELVKDPIRLKEYRKATVKFLQEVKNFMVKEKDWFDAKWASTGSKFVLHKRDDNGYIQTVVLFTWDMDIFTINQKYSNVIPQVLSQTYQNIKDNSNVVSFVDIPKEKKPPHFLQEPYGWRYGQMEKEDAINDLVNKIEENFNYFNNGYSDYFSSPVLIKKKNYLQGIVDDFFKGSMDSMTIEDLDKYFYDKFGGKFDDRIFNLERQKTLASDIKRNTYPAMPEMFSSKFEKFTKTDKDLREKFILYAYYTMFMPTGNVDIDDMLGIRNWERTDATSSDKGNLVFSAFMTFFEKPF